MDKSIKFKELANKRVNKAIKDIHLIGNLSNRSSYEYSGDDVQKVFRALEQELAKAKSRFAETTEGAGAFRL